jgi:hypothetical protein
MDVSIHQGGDATLVITYSLNPVEYIGVFLNLVNPGQELEKILESQLQRDITVISVNPSETRLHVVKFASVSGADYATSSIDFSGVKDWVAQQWFAPLVSVDMRTDCTVTFPDGYQQSASNTEKIPSIIHRIV